MPSVRSLLQPILGHPAFKAAREALAGGRASCSLAGLTKTAKSMVVACLARELRRPLVVMTSDNQAAEDLRKAASTFFAWAEGPAGRAAVDILPAYDCSPYENRSPHPEIMERRAVALWNVAQGRTSIIFVPIPAVLARFRPATFYRSLALEFKVGDEVSREDLVEHLSSVGYESAEPVVNPGQYSVRGGIVDVFPPEGPGGDPVRIEFLDDRIESLREFDPSSQRSRKTVASALLLPLSEARRSKEFFSKLVSALASKEAARSGKKRQHTAAEPDWAPAYSAEFPGWEFNVPLVERHSCSLLALFENPVLVWDEPLDRTLQLKQSLEDLQAKYEEVRDAAPPRPQPGEICFSQDEFLASIVNSQSLALQELALEKRDAGPAVAEASHSLEAGQAPQPRPLFILNTQPAPKFHGNVKALAEDLRARIDRREVVAFVLPGEGKIDRLREILTEYQIPFESCGDIAGLSAGAADAPHLPASPGAETSIAESPLTPGVAVLARGNIEEGFGLPDPGIVLISNSDLFGEFAWGAPARRERTAISSFLSDLSDLKVGDYVVHIDHGIGQYQGLRQLGVDGSPRDFMLLTFLEDARLYVPLERLDLVEKYRSGEGAKPPLDRLGGTAWVRTKTRVKRALRDMAAELLQVYAERKMRGGVAYSADTPWQREFEDAFEFEETPDQLTALDDLKRDLESPQPMDRLLCGDVGYGKTELAMRAAFKVVQDGKQVAVLAPTTVLAFQHFNTFRQRMAAFPVRIEMLSRFRSAARQKQVVAETEAGRIDLVIGTHRLLSKDVRFRDLGLLIVDEEQRFGVAAKEKLKKLKAIVDVLTLSATPIPRTLHMSIGGLRDLSVIETPPRGRLAIQTVVAPFTDGLIQSAILHEMEREGQVFFVHNRVDNIFGIAALLQRLVPTARIGVAHGQMGERELEKVMLKFVQGQYDVLVSTSIIENGLDIPRANTILVNHADRFGLADLYQLRGRVGRSNRRAYAYFLVAAEEALTPIAKRRLAALKEFSDLGAGFRLAALDLELRGTGNLLGAEQSGHLNSIGIDLYLHMLEQTVEELKGAPAKPEVRTTLNLGLDIKIPDAYIEDESQRLRMYKRISNLATSRERADLESELEDRYGPVPQPVSNLLDYALLKSTAEELWVQSIERKADEVWMRFHSQAPVSPDKLTQFVRRHRGASFRPDGALRFRLPASEGSLPGDLTLALRELHSQD